MKRATYIFAALSLLLIADGIYLEVSNNQQGCGCNGDAGTLFGGATSINLSTGTEVLIGGGLLLIVTGLVWAIGLRRGRRALAGGGQPAPAAHAAPAAQSAPAAQAAPATEASRKPAPASQAQVSAAAPGQAGQAGKETGDQR